MNEEHGRTRIVARRRVVTGGVVAVGAALGVTGAWRSLPGLGDPPVSAGPRNGFAVLDRPPTAEERAYGRPRLTRLFELAKDEAVDGDGARLLGGRGDDTAVLVAIRRKGQRPAGSGPRPFSRLCLTHGDGLVFVSCGTLNEVLHGAIGGASTSSTDGSREPSHFYGLVPNVVERIEVTFSGRVKSLSSDVVDNFYDVASDDPDATNRVGRTRWLDAAGRDVAH